MTGAPGPIYPQFMMLSERYDRTWREIDVHLSMLTRQGSFQHYHHFLLGFLIPLVTVWDELTKGGPCTVFVRSCALMDPLLLELNLAGLEILPVRVHHAMRERIPSSPCREVAVRGYDWPEHYDGRAFAVARRKLQSILKNGLRDEEARLSRRFSGLGEKVLVIRRLPPDAFYASAESEAKTAGAQRRSIANFDALTEILSRLTDNLLVTSLDGTSFAEQMARFAWADVIIAQHGAALSNLVWARPGTRVIEIVPREFEGALSTDDFFGALADCLGLRLRKLWQALPHGPVDLDDVHAALSAWCAAPQE